MARGDYAKMTPERRAQHIAGVAAWRKKGNNAERHYWYQQKVRYGITREWYEAQMAKQGGGCAICGTKPQDIRGQRHLYVDHDHACCPGRKSCGKCLRGLLCKKCNWLVGVVETYHGEMDRARAYILRTFGRLAA